MHVCHTLCHSQSNSAAWWSRPFMTRWARWVTMWACSTGWAPALCPRAAATASCSPLMSVVRLHIHVRHGHALPWLAEHAARLSCSCVGSAFLPGQDGHHQAATPVQPCMGHTVACVSFGDTGWQQLCAMPHPVARCGQARQPCWRATNAATTGARPACRVVLSALDNMLRQGARCALWQSRKRCVSTRPEQSLHGGTAK